MLSGTTRFPKLPIQFAGLIVPCANVESAGQLLGMTYENIDSRASYKMTTSIIMIHNN